MAKKKKNKIEPLVSEEQQKKLQALANEMITIASNLIDEYEDEDLDFSSLASLSGSAQFITQIHEDSPYLDDVFKGEAWKKIIKNIPTMPEIKDKKDDTE